MLKCINTIYFQFLKAESYLKSLGCDLIEKLPFHFDIGVFVFLLECQLGVSFLNTKKVSLGMTMALSLWLTLKKG